MPKVTIEDISRQTGLSRGTVSRALNDRPDISQQTKLRVLEACRELNYVPSQAARSLATGRNYAVGVIVDSLEQVHAMGLLRGVISSAEQASYAVCVAELGDNPEQRRSRLNRVLRERIDAVILAAHADEPVRQTLQDALAGQPLAATDAVDGIAGDVFAPDYRESGRLVARHLFSLAGAGQTLYVWRASSAGAGEALAGFGEIAAEQGIDPAGVMIEMPESAQEQDFVDVLQPRLHNVRALGASDDMVAAQLMLVAARLGRSVGVDLAVMGQGDMPLSRALRPTLTTTDWGGFESGQRVMELLLQRLNHARMDGPQTTRVAPTLLDRNSTRLSS